MKWKSYTIETTTDAVDLISAMLADLGVEGIEVQDNVPLTEAETKGMFIDVLPELPPDDGTARVTFYAEEDSDTRELLIRVREGLDEMAAYADLGTCRITSSETEDVDWINNWKKFFHAFSVGRIRIRPSWERGEDTPAEDIVIEIDPGTAFGTGSHETTQLCLTALQERLRGGERVIDIGTGSGILGIAAAKLGASFVYGTDIDEAAARTARENADINGIGPDLFPVEAGDLISDKAMAERLAAEPYDVAVANILAPVILMLVDAAAPLVKSGGTFITSGIIDTAEADVVRAFTESPYWDVADVRAQGDWRSVVAVRR